MAQFMTACRWAITAVGGRPVDTGIGEVIVATPDGMGAPGRVLIAVKATGRVTFCS